MKQNQQCLPPISQISLKSYMLHNMMHRTPITQNTTELCTSLSNQVYYKRGNLLARIMSFILMESSREYSYSYTHTGK